VISSVCVYDSQHPPESLQMNRYLFHNRHFVLGAPMRVLGLLKIVCFN